MRNNIVYCFYDGEITTLDRVRISPYDLGFLRAHGVFDVMRTANARAFLLDEHWDRLVNSAQTFGLTVPVSRDEFDAIVSTLLEKNNFIAGSGREANIRTILTGGESNDGFTFGGDRTFIILIEEFKQLPSDMFENGASVVTAEYERQIPRVKYMDYKFALATQGMKTENNAVEIVYVRGGDVLEASTSNIFIVSGGKIMTPEDGVLHGVTRNKVIELAGESGLRVERRVARVEELLDADEVFLTASSKDILPIVRVDSSVVGSGAVGSVTKNLMDAYGGVLRGY